MNDATTLLDLPLPDPVALPDAMQLLTRCLLAGTTPVLEIYRAEGMDRQFANRMYIGKLFYFLDDPFGEDAGALRFLGKGLDAAGKPLVTPTGERYIQLTPDPRQVGDDLPAVEVGTPPKTAWHLLGLLQLFSRQGQYTGEFHTGVASTPRVRLTGALAENNSGDKLIRCHLSLSAPAVPEAPPLRMVPSSTLSPEACCAG